MLRLALQTLEVPLMLMMMVEEDPHCRTCCALGNLVKTISQELRLILHGNQARTALGIRPRCAFGVYLGEQIGSHIDCIGDCAPSNVPVLLLDLN